MEYLGTSVVPKSIARKQDVGGGSTIETLTISVPSGVSDYYEYVLTSAGVTETNKIQAWLAAELDAENDVETLNDDNMNVYAIAETGQIRFALTGNGAFIGDYKVNYMVGA